MDNSGRFYAKILLLGEYGVIMGSRALTIPFTHFMGELSNLNEEKYTDNAFALESNRQLAEYLAWLKSEPSVGQMLHLDLLEEDIKNGLYFECTIPQGYGIGSSGALVAAIWHKYAREGQLTEKPTQEIILRLKKNFSLLESFFHGTSSGIDPLIALLKTPLHIKSSDIIEPTGIPRQQYEGPAAIFLLDAGRVGKTHQYVSLFLKKCENQEYSHSIKNIYIPLINQGIDYLLAGNQVGFLQQIAGISAFQAEYFEEMIPEEIRDVWQMGLSSDLFKLKLCGSGGGGFTLGFTTDFGKTEKLLKNNGFSTVPVFQHKQLTGAS
ncbi:MAG: mevalonate kinase family protein [Bacteroidales bacterium]